MPIFYNKELQQIKQQSSTSIWLQKKTVMVWASIAAITGAEANYILLLKISDILLTYSESSESYKMINAS